MKNSIIFAIFIVLISFADVKSFEINCDFQTWGMDIGFVYACETTSIPISSDQTVTNITGIHQNGKTDGDVDAFFIFGNWTLNFVPKGVRNFFPNIKALSIWYSNFDTLHGEEFYEFYKLEYFQIYASNLTTISSTLFLMMPNLQVINFGFTSLERVGHSLFASVDISQLQWVGFLGNKCINEVEQNGNQNSIKEIINKLRVQCPYDDEYPTTTSLTTTTTEEVNLTCSDKKIEDLICDLKNEVEEIQQKLISKDERINKIETELTETQEDTKIKYEEIEANFQNELTKMREETQKMMLELKNANEIFQSRILWLEDELSKISTNPCQCK
ncbi:hypothetical protein PVAND_017382 [Polypedilum vanderplanki]|uniref:Uncharacterized protein n=1 Tax=Polypedilum vanderplanki TaxID=319348 RepID=A0A9J6BIV7_POLVA|nr:hypothetical protein PVAND_017382 [Polypedilum vanderplanki]